MSVMTREDVTQKEVIFLVAKTVDILTVGHGNESPGNVLEVTFVSINPDTFGVPGIKRPSLTMVGQFVLVFHHECSPEYQRAGEAFELGARYKLVRVD